MEAFAGRGELLLRPADPRGRPQLEEDLEGGPKMLPRIATATHPPQALSKAQLGSSQLEWVARVARQGNRLVDRKSTRLNSSHSQISYAVFCLKKNTDH